MGLRHDEEFSRSGPQGTLPPFMSDHDQAHGIENPSHPHNAPLSDIQLRVRALESLLLEKGLVDPAALDELVDTYETRVGPRNGAQVVARAWTDPEFKRRLLDSGAKALVVSNHGGRQLDDVAATLDALPAVASMAAGKAEVLVDGGIRRGTDVLKAIALGARAVLLGRPILWGLAVAGESGVERVLQLIRSELELELGLRLSGCGTVDAIDGALVVPSGSPGGL
jgi:FMN-dependent dehydrogenase/nitrile hydratase alpha subunit